MNKIYQKSFLFKKNPAKGHISGFTLIELLVVVLIIGILSSIALPQYTKAVKKARLAGVMSMMSSLQKAVDIYLLENGGFPDSSTNLLSNHLLNIDIGSCAGGRCSTDMGNWYATCGSSECNVSISFASKAGFKSGFSIGFARKASGVIPNTSNNQVGNAWYWSSIGSPNKEDEKFICEYLKTNGLLNPYNYGGC